MNMLVRLWKDERGYIVSAELITLCTLGVIGGVVGLNAASKAVNEELLDVACAIRSLDQSYSFEGRQVCGAWTAGSSFQQEPVDVSVQRLRESAEKQEKQLEKKARRKAQEDKEPELRKKQQKRRSDTLRKSDEKPTQPQRTGLSV